jgi:hypothetical protein
MPKTAPFDPDAQAFITAAGITNPTQQSAINTLVVDLKGYNIWTKFKAIYPIVGGSASSHAVNLKTPGTYNMSFATGVTHSSTGMISGGAGYADTNLNQSLLSQNSTHLSFYSRTNLNANQAEIGIHAGSYNLMQIRVSGTAYYLINTPGLPTVAEADSRGFFIGNRQASNDIDAWKNGVKILNGTTASGTVASGNLFLLAYNNIQGGGGAAAVSTKQCAFASIGDGLTDIEAANFYTAVQAFQTTLNRQVGVPIVSDSDAQAFLNAAVIEDVTQANAINNLVIGLKADGLWTKMKAIYPIVGGTAASHKFNLKDPRDLNAAFRLTFATGWTHSATGMTPNGSSAFANTNLIESSVLTFNNIHLSVYSRTNSDGNFCDLGSIKGFGFNNVLSGVYPKSSNVFITRINDENPGISNTISSLGHFISNRISSTELRSRQNGVLKQITVNSVINSQITNSYYIGALNGTGYGLGPLAYSNRECAFASIGDGLTDTDATNLYTRVNTYQTALSRNV